MLSSLSLVRDSVLGIRVAINWDEETIVEIGEIAESTSQVNRHQPGIESDAGSFERVAIQATTIANPGHLADPELPDDQWQFYQGEANWQFLEAEGRAPCITSAESR